MKTYVKIFRDPAKLKELFSLLKKGFSYASIARHFGADHSSIIYQVKKHHLNITKKVKIPEPPKPKETYPLDRKYYPIEDVLLEDKINPGHSYAEYLAIEKRRKEESILKELLNKANLTAR